MEYDEDAGPDEKFRKWLDVLDEDVIQDEFGYERGEFDVFPALWHPLYAEGLTPRQAWQRALDGFAEGRADRDRQKAENWKRIQIADAALSMTAEDQASLATMGGLLSAITADPIGRPNR